MWGARQIVTYISLIAGRSVNPQTNPHLVLSSTTSAYLGSPRGFCKSLKNLMVVPCHGRGLRSTWTFVNWTFA